MGTFNWAKSFEEQPTCKDILNRVRRIERIYWIMGPVSIILILAGIILIVTAPENNIKMHNYGVFLAIYGGIILAMNEICTCVKISALRVIWDSQNRIENEIRKSEALDL